MRLVGARVAIGPSAAERRDLEICRGHILPRGSSRGPALSIDLDGHLILPGLINCHDHLEFNLFPKLGHGPYPNAAAWADDIYHPDRSPIKEHLAVPKAARLHWGGLKNLLSGVTTVAHHNPYEAEVFENGFPVRVLKRFGWAHSLRFSSDVAERYQAGPTGWPFLIHAAEGTDQSAASEIPELECAGVLGSRTVLIHGVGILCDAFELLLERQVSVIWCPSSNLFTLSETLRPEVLRSGIPVGLGTDSAITCENDLAAEARVALRTGSLAAEEVYRMVTSDAARILRLHRGEGEIREHGVADLLVVRDHGGSPADALQDFSPELVILGGKIQLVSSDLAAGIDGSLTRRLRPIRVEGRGVWLVDSSVSQLCVQAEAALGPDWRLAGRRVRA